jgi:hypothetical protein
MCGPGNDGGGWVCVPRLTPIHALDRLEWGCEQIPRCWPGARDFRRWTPWLTGKPMHWMRPLFKIILNHMGFGA